MINQEEIIKRRLWIFSKEFLPSVEEVLMITTFEEYCEIVVPVALQSAIEDIGRNDLANKIIISYDLFFEEIKYYFEMGGYNE